MKKVFLAGKLTLLFLVVPETAKKKKVYCSHLALLRFRVAETLSQTNQSLVRPKTGPKK